MDESLLAKVAFAEQTTKMGAPRTLEGMPVKVVSQSLFNFVKSAMSFLEHLHYSVENLKKEPTRTVDSTEWLSVGKGQIIIMYQSRLLALMCCSTLFLVFLG